MKLTTPIVAALRPLRRVGCWLLLWLAIVLAAVWSTMAIYYSNLPTTWLRGFAAVAYALGLVGIFVRVRPLRRAKLAFLAAVGVVIVWFLIILPSNHRDWQSDVALLPYADLNGDRVTLHNIRNCDYRSETDYDVHHYDKTLDLAKLRSVDLYVVYWGSPLICHTMMSFGFEGDDYVCISIETRKEKGEGFSAIKGFFRQFELTYVVADERDLVRLRTNYRGEQVYLYRLNTEAAVARLVFLDYLKQVNRLKERPQWYNALTANCTTLIRGHTKAYAKEQKFDWRILVNGRIDEMAYQRKSLDQSLPFAQLRARSLINDRARATPADAAYSRRIREQLPGIAAPIPSAQRRPTDRSPQHAICGSSKPILEENETCETYSLTQAEPDLL
ncbi:MAG TPA: DUF4105 domain-containing protein [Verrucomicrobiae bacterium]|nr:DUF4105 domain-containing protein [Verrucomicrobiae bacterium]